MPYCSPIPEWEFLLEHIPPAFGCFQRERGGKKKGWNVCTVRNLMTSAYAGCINCSYWKSMTFLQITMQQNTKTRILIFRPCFQVLWQCYKRQVLGTIHGPLHLCMYEVFREITGVTKDKRKRTESKSKAGQNLQLTWMRNVSLRKFAANLFG